MKLIDETISWPGLHGRADSAKTQVQIFENIADERYGDKVVILTELPDNAGCSVTNGVEILAKLVSHRFGLKPATTWIEHYLADEHRGDAGETFDLVVFGQPYNFRSVTWTKTSWTVVRPLISDGPVNWADL